MMLVVALQCQEDGGLEKMKTCESSPLHFCIPCQAADEHNRAIQEWRLELGQVGEILVGACTVAVQTSGLL